MPIGEFEFLDNFQSFYYQWKYWTGNEENGFILEVDLECPESLHEIKLKLSKTSTFFEKIFNKTQRIYRKKTSVSN